MTKKVKNNLPEWFTAGVAFIYYWIMALYKLTDAPIWQDEAMEFYCSIPVKGAIRGITQYTTMYERMANIQQQPPLYNWLMCLWLQINEGEWWFRFSSVIMGFIAVIGLYFLIKKLCNHFTAVLSVYTFSSIYILMYYVKEASEYILLIMLLIWTVYIYLQILEKISIKRILLFTMICVIDIYTHYAAAFVIVPMAVQILYYIWKNGDKKALGTGLISYVVAGLGAGLPLIYFFVLPQSMNSNSTLGVDKAIEITGNNIIFDFFYNLMSVLRWNMLDNDRDSDKLTWAIWIILIGVIILAVFCFVKTKRKEIRYLLVCNAGIYLSYYILTKLNIYAYGWFGNRYNLFLLPIWFIMITALLYEFIQIMMKSMNERVKKFSQAVRVLIVLGTLLFCCYGVKRINDHWDKCDLRQVVSTWYDEDGYETPTFVNYHLRYGFVYYFTHNEKYQENQWDKLYTSQNLDSMGYSNEEWLTFLEEEVYPDGLPKKLYVVSGRRDTIVDALQESAGYEVTPVVDTTAKLFLLTASE